MVQFCKRVRAAGCTNATSTAGIGSITDSDIWLSHKLQPMCSAKPLTEMLTSLRLGCSWCVCYSSLRFTATVAVRPDRWGLKSLFTQNYWIKQAHCSCDVSHSGKKKYIYIYRDKRCNQSSKNGTKKRENSSHIWLITSRSRPRLTSTRRWLVSANCFGLVKLKKRFRNTACTTESQWMTQ